MPTDSIEASPALSTSDRLQAALRAADIVVWDLDLSTDHAIRDGASVEVLGIASGTGRDFARLVHPEDRSKVDAALAAAYSGSARYDVEFRIIRPDGAVRWLRETGNVYRDRQGRPIRLTGATRDITDRRLANEALRDSNERLRLAVAATGLGTWDIDPPTESREWSAEFKAILGLPADTVGDWKLFQSLIHPEDRERVVLQFRKGYDAHSDGRYGSEFRIRRADDGAERWVVAAGQVFFDAAGKPIRSVGTLTDVTEARREAEMRLESEGRFRHLANALPAFVWFAAADGEVEFLNDRWLDYTGLTIDQSRGDGWVAAVHPEDRERGVAVWRQALQQAVPFAVEQRYRRNDGVYRWHITRAEPVRDAGGRITAWFGTGADIDGMKRAEGALRDSEERYRQVVEISLEGIWVHCDGNIVFANSQAARMFGAACPADLIGRPVLTLAHPEERERAAARMRTLTEQREPVPLTEMRFLGAGGQTILLEVQAIPFEYQGQSAILAVGRDVTDRKRTEETLVRYRLLSEHARDIILLMRFADCRIVEANAAAIAAYGYDRDAILTKTIYDLRTPETHAQIEAQVAKANAAPEGIVFETVHRRADGSVFPVEVSWRIATLGGERLLLSIIRDISERKSIEERQALLMAELDHRVRNILASVQAMVSLTGRSVATKDEYSAALQGRVAAMGRAHDLLSRRRWHGADLADVVHDALQAYGDAIATDGERGCMLRAKDALTLTLVLHELATNAAKYGGLSGPAGRVTIGWRRQEAPDRSSVRLTWQESGGPTVTPPARRGFGSQLIESALPGVHLDFDPSGVRCDIRLGLRRPDPRPDSEALAANTGTVDDAVGEEKPLHGLRVLLVEDDPMTALALQAMLQGAGASISAVASTLQEALAESDSDIAAAVLDVNLDGEMVYPLAGRLMDRGVPIIFATGYDVRTTLPESLRNVPTLQKPVDGPTLVRRLVEITRRAA